MEKPPVLWNPKAYYDAQRANHGPNFFQANSVNTFPIILLSGYSLIYPRISSRIFYNYNMEYSSDLSRVQ
jgi:hypothetical protein